MLFSEGTLNEIRARLSIVELVSEYVSLKKSGQSYLGLCPFHNEKTPSFHVHPVKGCFHCFGCHKGGNVFSFFSAVEGISFPEAVRKLAERTGVRIEEDNYRKSSKPQPNPAENRLLVAQEWAAKYFHYLLMESKEYLPAKEYLKSRGISDSTITKFQIGVSPRGWNTLLTAMTKRGFSFAELVQAGLVIEKQGAPNNGYDRFRYRLMFPIRDPEGRAVGFGARLLTNEDQPKYINSPETALFSKRSLLYGQYENARGIRLKGEAVIVEGYMDVVGLFEHGVRNALATMGTALTEDHCRQLRPLTRRVVTVFDPDSAGSDAWHRSVHLLLSCGIFAKDLTLPSGKDPDEFVAQEGPEKFFELCDKSPRQITKLLKEIAQRGSISEEERTKVLTELTPILVASRKMPDRALLWDSISLVLKVSVALLKELAENPGPSYSSLAPSKSPSQLPSGACYAQKPLAKPLKPLNPLDFEFFQASLRAPMLFLRLPKDMWRGRLQEKRIEQWLEKLSTAVGPKEFSDIIENEIAVEADPQILAKVSERLINPEESTSPDHTRAFESLVERLIQRGRETEIKALSAAIRLAERMGNEEEQLRLLGKLKELRTAK